MALDPEFKAKWVAALRSGEYHQAHNALCKYYRNREYAYCCLGVARSVLGSDAKELLNGPSYGGSILSVLGLDIKARKFLAHMNDDDGKSFAEIADYIEAHL